MDSQYRVAHLNIKILNVTDEYYKAFWLATRNCYFKGMFSELDGEYSEEKATILLMKIIHLGHDSCLEHINFQIVLEGVSRSFMAQITRHRHITFHISSQHFQNHSDFLFVKPKFKSSANENEFMNYMNTINYMYKTILENGDPHYVARQVLPNAASCKIIMTINLRELRHVIKVRNGIENTPEMQDVMKELINVLDRHDPLFLFGLGVDVI